MDHLAIYPDSPDEVDMPRSPKRPPPPPQFFDMPAGKRIREQPLQLPLLVPVQPREDSFLVHVFLPVTHSRLDAFVNRLMGMARLRLTGGKVKAPFKPLIDFHVSVARPVAIREAQIRGLVADLRNAVSRCSSVRLAIQAKVEGFASANGHRVFVAAPLTKSAGSTVARGLIKAVDSVFEKHKLPTFFKDPRPHMSFAWTDVVDVLPQFSGVHSALGVSAEEDVLELFVNKVVCSIGKSNYYFTLK